MLAVGIILENPNFVNGLNQVLNKVSKSNIMLLPFWKGGERT